MHHEFSENFNVLREEFRSFQSELRIKSTMAERTMNNNWFTAALLNATNTSIDSDPSIGSSSSHLSPFKSCDSSHSSVESERAQSEVPTTTVVLGGDDLPTPLQTHRHTAEHGEESLYGSVVQQRPRKGHRKSREGCFNCKRRKIKVSISVRSRLGLT